MAGVIVNGQTEQLLAELATPAGRTDPYPRYEQLRRIAPFALADDGSIVVTRYADCNSVLRNPRFGNDPDRQFTPLGYPDWRHHPAMRTFFGSLFGLNPPDHTRLRALVSLAFTPRRVAELRPWVEQLVDEQLAAMPDEGDFVASFAFPLPMAVIGQLLGIPTEDRAQFQPLVRQWFQVGEIPTPDVVTQADAAAGQIRDYLGQLIAAKRANPTDDLLSALIAARLDDDRFTEDELVTMAAILMAAGFETTTLLLGNALVTLLDHPDQFALLRADPDLASGAVEEILRFDSPVQIANRTAMTELPLAGNTLPPGQRVVTYLGAANRDPARFPDPDRLDISRTDNHPLSFAAGIHHCLGAALARMETQVALRALATSYPHLDLAGEPQPRPGLSLRGFTCIPIHTCRPDPTDLP